MSFTDNEECQWNGDYNCVSIRRKILNVCQ